MITQDWLELKRHEYTHWVFLEQLEFPNFGRVNVYFATKDEFPENANMHLNDVIWLHARDYYALGQQQFVYKTWGPKNPKTGMSPPHYLRYTLVTVKAEDGQRK